MYPELEPPPRSRIMYVVSQAKGHDEPRNRSKDGKRASNCELDTDVEEDEDCQEV